MPGLSMHVTLDDHEVLRMLSQMQAKARDMKPAFKNIGEYMLRETEKRFAGEHDPEGNKWRALSPVTLGMTWRMKGRKTHTKRGAMTKGFERFSLAKKILTGIGNLRRHVYEAGNNSVTIGPSIQAEKYAAIHRFGGQAGRGRKVKIPARPYLGINNADEREAIEILKEFLLP